MRERLHSLLEGPEEGATGLWLRLAIQVLIILNVAAVIAETVEPVGLRYADWFRGFELLSVGLFTIEYLTRLGVCTADPGYRRPIIGRLRWAITPLAIVDLLAILPAYLPLLFGVDLRGIRAV